MGGGTKILHIYAEALTKRGHDVLVVSLPEQTPSIFNRFLHFAKTSRWPSLTKRQTSFFDHSLAKHKVLESYRPIVDADLPDADVVIATWWETAEWANALSPSKGKKVYFVQGHEVFHYLPIDRVKKTYNYPMQKIAVSNWLAGVMKSEYGDNNCVVVPNCIDHSQFFAEKRQKSAIPTVGFLYSSSYVKGVNTTLKAIKKLKQSIPNLRVISFGASHPDGCVDWDDFIEFHHNPEQKDIKGLYSQCDVWLSASLSEGFNLTVMEAMACGTPVVSTRTGWPMEVIIPSINGFLIDMNDVNGMVGHAKEALDMTSMQWQVMSQHATSTVEDCHWGSSFDKFESVLFKLVKT